MRRFCFALLALALFALPGAAQSPVPDEAADDKSFLEGWLEKNLSDAGRDVRIIGFQGALSTRATMEALTLSDDDGIWLRLEGVSLDWDRTAILGGRLIAQDLSVERVDIIRRPLSASGPRTTSSSFRLPELPVAIDIQSLAARRVILGEAVMGYPAELTLSGAAQLEEGSGEAAFTAQRVDDEEGQLRLSGAFSNETGRLSLDISLQEGGGGIVAKLVGLPGKDALDLKVSGDGLIEDFRADLSLATAGVPRVTGSMKLAVADGEAARFDVDVRGDVSALILPEFQEFFGPQTTLKAVGQRFSNGTLRLADLSFDSQQMRVRGSATINGRGWPERANLKADISAPDAGDVLLPFGGAPTRVSRADVSFDYDVLKNKEWTATAQIEGVAQPGLSIAKMSITGAGQLSPGGADRVAQIIGQSSFSASGIAPLDPAMAQAIGSRIAGVVRFSKVDERPGRFSRISLSGADYGLSGTAIMSLDPKALDLLAAVDLKLSMRDLSRLSGLLGRPVAGAVFLDVEGDAALPGGAIDLVLSGTGRDLSANVTQIDPLFAGASALDIAVVRGPEGTRIETLRIASTGAELTGFADLAEGDGAVELALIVRDGTLMDPALVGSLEMSLEAAQRTRVWDIAATAKGPGEAELSLEATAQSRTGGVGAVAGDVVLGAQDLSPYRGLIGLDLSGALAAEAFVGGDLVSGGFGAIGEAKTQGLRLGLGVLDQLVTGSSSLSFDMTRREDGTIVLNELSARTPELDLDARGSDAETTDVNLAAKLRDLGVLVPGFVGAFTANGNATLIDGSWAISASGAGPGGTSLETRGQLAGDFGTAHLALNGQAPLALVNPFISPRQLDGMAQYDLSVNGPLALSSLAGSVSVTGGRASLPILKVALDPLVVRAQISGGTARVDASAGVSSGGSISVAGPVAMMPPYQSSLGVLVSGVGVTDPAVLDTVVDGSLSLDGALLGGARISGQLRLGQAELRIPTSGFGTFPAMKGLVHLNEPTAVFQTRKRAGFFSANGSQERGANSVPYPLDVTLSAPARVFLRGRGIDAELGGQIRIGGTTDDIVPQGAFELIRGRIDFLGKRLTMVEANATLLGSFDPYIRAVAQTDLDGVMIQVRVEGRATEPEITFSSVPDLPQDEILARLVFGRSLAEISPLQALQLANGIATLAGSGDGGLTGRLRQGFGFADLDITTDADGTAAVRAGAYLGENLYSDVSVNAQGEAEVNINLDLSPNLTARGRLSTTGDTGIGIYFEKDY